MRVFENNVAARVFEPKTEAVTAERRKLHDDELHNLCSTKY
jgi:hypothetical protein